MSIEILEKHFEWRNGKLSKKYGSGMLTDKYFNDTYMKVVGDLMTAGTSVPPEEFRDYVVGEMPEPMAKPASEYDLRWETFDRPEDWVMGFLTRNKLQIMYDKSNPGKKLFDKNDLGTDKNKWLTLAYKNLHDYNFESKQFDEAQNKHTLIRDIYTKESIKDTMMGMMPELEIQRKPAMRNKLRFREDGVKIVNEVLNLFLETMGAKTEFNLKMMKHWMWQVKCFMYDTSPVSDPIFINFFASQGTGKTTFIRALLNALSEYTFEPQMDAVRGEKYAKLWGSRLVIFFDEIRMSSGDKKEMASMMANLKYLLTMDTSMYRQYHTQDMQEEPRIFSAISTSNVPLIDILYDKTGMRRFYEIACNITAGDKTFLKLPWIKNPDREISKTAERVYRNMWNGIDENLKEGYLNDEDRKELVSIQDSYLKMDCVDTYEALQGYDEEPFIEVSENGSEMITELKNKLLIDPELNKDKFESLCESLGYDAHTTSSYISEIKDWCESEKTELFIYGDVRMPRELEARGKFVFKHGGIHYVFRKIQSREEKRSKSRIGG